MYLCIYVYICNCVEKISVARQEWNMENMENGCGLLLADSGCLLVSNSYLKKSCLTFLSFRVITYGVFFFFFFIFLQLYYCSLKFFLSSMLGNKGYMYYEINVLLICFINQLRQPKKRTLDTVKHCQIFKTFCSVILAEKFVLTL